MTIGRERMEAYVDSWDALQLQIADLFELRGRLEMEMRTCMEAINAEEFRRNGIDVTYKPVIEWVEGSLAPLGEALKAEGLDPEVYLQKPKPRGWDKRKLSKLSKQGGAIRDIIDDARVELSPVLKVKRGYRAV